MRFLLSGTLGLAALALVLYRDGRDRLLFSIGSLGLLALYAWSGTETVRIEVTAQGSRVTVRAGDTVVSADVPASGGRAGLAIEAPAATPSPEGWLSTARVALEAILTQNLSAGAEVHVTDLDGRPLLASPVVLWSAGEEQDDAFQAGDVGGLPRVFGRPDWRDVAVELDLRNGTVPTTLFLHLDDQLNGVAVRAWPEWRQLTIHRVQHGRVGEQIAGGYQLLHKPALAALQSLMREVLRAWLVGLGCIAAGAALLPLARLVPGPSDWLAPPGAALLTATLLAVGCLVATGWIASDVLERIPHVQDSVAYLFQAKTFALGRLSVPLPPVPEAFDHEFILQRDGAWFSKYPPGHPVILALGAMLGHPWLVAPFEGAATILALYGLGRVLFGGGTGLLASVLLLSSPFFLFMSGSMMSHPTGLLLTTVGLLLVAWSSRSERSWPPLLAGIAFGWLFASRQLTGLAVAVPASLWLLAARLRQGRCAGPVLVLLVLGWSWPALALLAYNRALTGNPWLNPFELWWSFDRVGFGPSVGMHGGHDLARGLWNTFLNLTALERDLYGWPVYLTLAFAVLPFVTGRARGGDWLAAGVTVSLMAAYVAYWADGLMFGPRYFYEASSALALLTARGLLVAAEVSSGVGRSLLRRRATPASAPFFTAVLVLLVGGNLAVNLPQQVELHRGYNYVDGHRLAIVREAGIHRALVFVPTSDPLAWWEYGSVFSANDPLLQADVIYARDLGPVVNRRTMEAFPERTPYRLDNNRLVRLTPPR